MKFKTPEGEIALRKVSDSDYRKARKLANKHSLDVCPTCGGKEEYVVPGIKQFVSKTYRLDGEEHECDCKLQMALHIRYLLAGIGADYWPLRWENFKGDPEAKELVDMYLDKWENFSNEGMGIMFSSPIQGVGKTWGAAHIGKELIKRGEKVFFIPFQTMVGQLIREDTQAETEDKMINTTLLIIDEISEGFSDAQAALYANQFETVIRHRMSFNLPTITTTNLTKETFEWNFPRIGSLLDDKQIWQDVSGADYRRSRDNEEEKFIRIKNGEVRPIV